MNFRHCKYNWSKKKASAQAVGDQNPRIASGALYTLADDCLPLRLFPFASGVLITSVALVVSCEACTSSSCAFLLPGVRLPVPPAPLSFVSAELWLDVASNSGSELL